MRFANAEDGRSPRNPILAGFGPFCPQAMPRHDTAAPPSRLRISLRLMGFFRVQEVLTVRAGSLGIKAPYGRVGVCAHGPIGSSCERDVERLLPRGRWGSQRR